MKKAYTKPSFAPVKLDATGGSCDVEITNWGYESCSIDIPGVGLLYGGPQWIPCEFNADENEILCIMSFDPGTTVFGS